MDIILPFMLDNGFARGVYINADKTIADILACHDYPSPVQTVLAQTVVLTLALSANLKYDGTFSLHIRGKGPIQTLFVAATHDKKVRAYASFDKNNLPENNLTNAALFGQGELLFSVAQTGQEPYQGIVRLNGETLTDAVLDYFKQSEQIKTTLVLRTHENKFRCLLLQQMPLKAETTTTDATDLWETETVLLHSVRDSELFDEQLFPQEILYRLFHANGVTVYKGEEPEFFCPCHRSQMEKFLKQLTPDERAELFQNDQIVTQCQFCNNQYIFKKDDF